VILQIDEAIDDDVCRRLVALYDRHAATATGRDYTGHAVVYCFHDVTDAEACAMLREPVRAAWRQVNAALSPAAALYPETVILAAIGAGGHHPRHADNCQQDEHGAWLPNHTPQRAVSALYYLNGDFTGGELVFERQKIVIRPRPGLLVAFPSDQHHVHEVMPVQSGCRYSMPIWFTRQRTAALAAFAGPASADEGDSRATDVISPTAADQTRLISRL
jgi:predicted 2-oxoglutarate/Fe(II)-dependent dioxygenase YbiX